MLRKILAIIAILAIAILVFMATKYYYTWGEVKAREQSEVMIEKVKTVAKLVTVEGYFSEVYKYEDYWNYDYSMFRKKALIRVKAKVSIGYDLSKMGIEALPEQKKIILSNLPDPQIISIDHDLDYYDITEGTFNTFTEADYTMMNRNAKEEIRKTVMNSDLFLTAEKQGNQMLDLIRFMVEGADWTLEYKTREIPNPLQN